MEEEDVLPYPVLTHGEELQLLVDHCTTECMFDCCGYQSCDFQPVVIAEYLYRASSRMNNDIEVNVHVSLLREQLTELKGKFGVQGRISEGAMSEFTDMMLPAKTIELFVSDLNQNLDVALELLVVSQNKGQVDSYYETENAE